MPCNVAPMQPRSQSEIDSNRIEIHSPWVAYSVLLDGGISTAQEWSDADCYDLVMGEPNKAGFTTITTRWWVKNDSRWLYLLARLPAGAGDMAWIEYFWPPPFTGRWEHSDKGSVGVDGEVFDSYGWNETEWSDDTKASPPGKNDVQGSATRDTTYAWFEFRKALSSRDGYDWDWPARGTVGTEGDLLLGVWDSATQTIFRLRIKLMLGSEQTGTSKPLPSTPTRTATPAPPTMAPTPTLAPGATRVSDKDGMVMVYVPTGDFLMGSIDADTEAFGNEKPQHKVHSDAFWIDRTEVTNMMFARFVTETGHKTEAENRGQSWAFSVTTKQFEATSGVDWQYPRGPGSDLKGLGKHPVLHVSWRDAAAYCWWAGRRLPTEAEWEKAARGTDGRKYPWKGTGVAGDLLNYADRTAGVDWADKSVDDGYQFAAPVGTYLAGASPYGALDMAGNLFEWTSSLWGKNHEKPEFGYPYDPTDGREDRTAPDDVLRVLRGGGWHSDLRWVRTAVRSPDHPGSYG